jgi:hypothetical protein
MGGECRRKSGGEDPNFFVPAAGRATTHKKNCGHLVRIQLNNLGLPAKLSSGHQAKMPHE